MVGGTGVAPLKTPATRRYSSGTLMPTTKDMARVSLAVTQDLGVLRTGYLEKANPGRPTKAQRRYVVLTERRLHW